MLSTFLGYINRVFKSNLFKLSSIYTIANVIGVVIPFFLLPILTRYLTPYDYGILSMYSTLYSFLAQLAAFSSNSYIFTIWFKENLDLIKKINFNIILLNIISFFVIFFILYLFKSIIFNYTHLSLFWLFLLSINIFFDNIINFIVGIYRMENKVWNFVSFSIIRSLILFF
ncbi:MAG: lipopolysaccharide biosynthesis protein [bacterium]|jgi:O-antigen/teichoic acid export membrane protein